MEWLKTSYLVLELIVVWGLLNVLTKLPQDKMLGIAGLSIPFTIITLTLLDDFRSGTFHIVWYLLWTLVGIAIYFTVPMTYRHYLHVGRKFQKKNNERNKEDDINSKR